MEIVTTTLLWFSALATGLMAGIYFAFSMFIMKSLGVLEKPAGMVAMQSINRVILKSPFLPLFFASTIACLALIVIALMHWSAPGSCAMAGGGALYVVGMTGVTMAFNVPLNNRLEAADATSAEGEALWALYLKRWTAWNHVRTVACVIACGLLIWAIAARV